MAMFTVRNVPDSVHRALRLRAAQNGRSAEAEIREILERTVRPKDALGFGDELVSLGRAAALTRSELRAVSGARRKAPAKPMVIG